LELAKPRLRFLNLHFEAQFIILRDLQIIQKYKLQNRFCRILVGLNINNQLQNLGVLFYPKF
jgi:hypothetical protein